MRRLPSLLVLCLLGLGLALSVLGQGSHTGSGELPGLLTWGAGLCCLRAATHLLPGEGQG